MIRALALLMVLAVGLGGCGKKGAPSPLGPPDQILYPRAYPAQ
jgi:predicted small lipoprotein YifL